MNQFDKLRLNTLLENNYAGTCQAPDTGHFAEEHGFTQDEVESALDNLEIFECVGCNWWQHSGEIYLGHADDCEHDEMICGDCCEN